MRRFSQISLLALTGIAVASIAQLAGAPAPRQMPASGLDPALFNGLEFRSVGPPRGGRVTTVTGVPSEPRTFYMGVAAAGCSRRTDGGDELVPGHRRPGAARVQRRRSPWRTPTRTSSTTAPGRTASAATCRRAGACTRATDAGKTWSFAGLHDVGQIGAVRIHPTDPEHRLGVGAAATRSSPTPSAGSSRPPTAARRGGRRCSSRTAWARWTWSSSPATRTWSTRGCRTCSASRGRSSAAGRPARARASTRAPTAGEHFKKITTGLPADLVGKGNIAVTAANPSRLYALVEAKPGGGLYRSDDAGQTWTAMPSHDRRMIQRPFYYTRSAPTRPTPTWSTAAPRASTSPPTAGRRSPVDAHAARRQPRHLDQPERRQHDDPVERRRRERLVRRRPDVVDPVQPAHGRAVRRLDSTTNSPTTSTRRSRTTARTSCP